MSPVELLESNVVLTCGQVAQVLNQFDGHGRPRRDVVHRLIRAGALNLVDPEQPITRWTIAVSEVRRYIEGGARG